MISTYKTFTGLEKAAKREGYTLNCNTGTSVSLYKMGYATLLYIKEMERWVRA